MLLETGSKPIRIRIVSGGEEHSSLASMCYNFSLSDIIPTVNDGRLERWLHQKGEYKLAERISRFQFRSNVSQPDEAELLNFLYLFFPACNNQSLTEIVYVWQELKGYEKNYRHLLNYAVSLLSLDVILKGYNEAQERLSEKEWRSIAINFLRHVPLQKSISIYRDGIFAKLLKDDDWYGVFTNRADCKDALAFYSVWEVLSKIPKYENVAFRYLKKSAELDHPSAVLCMRKKEDEDLIDKFVDNPYVFNRDSKIGNDLKRFLKILGTSLKPEIIPKGEAGKYTKYLEVCEAIYKWKNWYGVGPKTCIKDLARLGKNNPNFEVVERLIQIISDDAIIEENKFSTLSYFDSIKFIVQLLKEYEL